MRKLLSVGALGALLSVGVLTSVGCATPRAGAEPSKASAEGGAPAPIAVFERVPNEVATSYDLTGDGKPDLWKFTIRDASGAEVLVRKEKDLNGDGKVDTWEKYGPDGKSVARILYDLDFDGRPDVQLFFEKDQLVKKELALGFDGIPRTWSYYEKGQLVRKERDTAGRGKVDTWEYWENGELDRIGVDTDGDGQVDRWDMRGAPAPAAGVAPQK